MKGTCQATLRLAVEPPATGTLKAARVRVTLPNVSRAGAVREISVSEGTFHGQIDPAKPGVPIEATFDDGVTPAWDIPVTALPWSGELTCTIDVNEGLVVSRSSVFPPALRAAPSDALAESARVEVGRGPIADLARPAIRGVHSAFDAVERLASLTTARLTFDATRTAPGGLGALSVVRDRRGADLEFAHLFAAFCRTLRLPCLVVGGVTGSTADGYVGHAWNVVSPDGREWWPVDTTEEPRVAGFADHHLPLFEGADGTRLQRIAIDKMEWEGEPGPPPECSPVWDFSFTPADEPAIAIHAVEIGGGGRGRGPEWLSVVVALDPGRESPPAVLPLLLSSEGALPGVSGSSSTRHVLAVRLASGLYRFEGPVRYAADAPSSGEARVPFALRVPGHVAHATFALVRNANGTSVPRSMPHAPRA